MKPDLGTAVPVDVNKTPVAGVARDEQLWLRWRNTTPRAVLKS
jgi:hypothetical protein